MPVRGGPRELGRGPHPGHPGAWCWFLSRGTRGRGI